MKKTKFITVLLAFVSACCLTFSSCSKSDVRGVVSIEKTSTNGLVDTYTVYYTAVTPGVVYLMKKDSLTTGANTRSA